MRKRLEYDLEQLDKNPIDHKGSVHRNYIGGEFGTYVCYLNFEETPARGVLKDYTVAVTIKISAEYPYSPPEFYCHQPGFTHPNIDSSTHQAMFSFIDKKNWKPTFELKQAVFGFEMILLFPENLYASVRGFELFRAFLEGDSRLRENLREEEEARVKHNQQLEKDKVLQIERAHLRKAIDEESMGSFETQEESIEGSMQIEEEFPCQNTQTADGLPAMALSKRIPIEQEGFWGFSPSQPSLESSLPSWLFLKKPILEFGSKTGQNMHTDENRLIKQNRRVKIN